VRKALIYASDGDNLCSQLATPVACLAADVMTLVKLITSADFFPRSIFRRHMGAVSIIFIKKLLLKILIESAYILSGCLAVSKVGLESARVGFGVLRFDQLGLVFPVVFAHGGEILLQADSKKRKTAQALKTPR
jgi:hypothetical protein